MLKKIIFTGLIAAGAYIGYTLYKDAVEIKEEAGNEDTILSAIKEAARRKVEEIKNNPSIIFTKMKKAATISLVFVVTNFASMVVGFGMGESYGIGYGICNGMDWIMKDLDSRFPDLHILEKYKEKLNENPDAEYTRWKYSSRSNPGYRELAKAIIYDENGKFRFIREGSIL